MVALRETALATLTPMVAVNNCTARRAARMLKQVVVLDGELMNNLLGLILYTSDGPRPEQESEIKYNETDGKRPP